MSEELELNCMGTKCPRPIIEIAKAARKVAKDSVLLVHADDLAFESDVKAWAERAGAEILDLEKDGDKVSVRISLGT
jgi:TusA-related sulfurtransferase